MSLLFIDTETGGLDPNNDALIEVSWMHECASAPTTILLPHDPARVSPEAAEINGYYRRGLDNPERWADERSITLLHTALINATLVGAKPDFDASFLAANGFGGWHYRFLDVQSMAVPLTGLVPSAENMALTKVPSLVDLVDFCRDRGYVIHEPDHSAANDVLATRDVYNALQDTYAWALVPA